MINNATSHKVNYIAQLYTPAQDNDIAEWSGNDLIFLILALLTIIEMKMYFFYWSGFIS